MLCHIPVLGEAESHADPSGWKGPIAGHRAQDDYQAAEARCISSSVGTKMGLQALESATHESPEHLCQEILGFCAFASRI